MIISGKPRNKYDAHFKSLHRNKKDCVYMELSIEGRIKTNFGENFNIFVCEGPL